MGEVEEDTKKLLHEDSEDKETEQVKKVDFLRGHCSHLKIEEHL
jgi:hypothetical protein